MKDDDFNEFDDPASGIEDEAGPALADNDNASHVKSKSRRLREYFEEKELIEELKDYDDFLESAGSYYDDDIFSEGWVKDKYN